MELTSLDSRMRRLQFDAARGGIYAFGESATCTIEGAYLVLDGVEDGSIVPADFSETPAPSAWLAAQGISIGSGLTFANGVLSAIVALPVHSLPANPTQGQRIILQTADSIPDNRTSTAVQDQITLRRLPCLLYTSDAADE